MSGSADMCDADAGLSDARLVAADAHTFLQCAAERRRQGAQLCCAGNTEPVGAATGVHGMI